MVGTPLYGNETGRTNQYPLERAREMTYAVEALVPAPEGHSRDRHSADKMEIRLSFAGTGFIACHLDINGPKCQGRLSLLQRGCPGSISRRTLTGTYEKETGIDRLKAAKRGLRGDRRERGKEKERGWEREREREIADDSERKREGGRARETQEGRRRGE